MDANTARKFKTALDRNTKPHAAVAEAFADNVVPLNWDDWRGTRTRHAGANDPALRLCEPDLPDVSGTKYLVAGGGPATKIMPLVTAMRWLIDRESPSDRVLVHGSRRPIALWKKVGKRLEPRIDFVGASVKEATALERCGLLTNTGADPVILRIRMRRVTLERIKKASEYERMLYADGRKGKYMSAAVLTPILEWLERCEAAIASLEAAHFSGPTP